MYHVQTINGGFHIQLHTREYIMAALISYLFFILLCMPLILVTPKLRCGEREFQCTVLNYKYFNSNKRHFKLTDER